jgi:lysophospholipase L1-like esterase
MRILATILAACFTLTGCVANLVVPLAAITTDGPAAITAYRAFGDSITAGVTLPSPSLAYPALIAQDRQFNLANYAIGGSQACDVPTTQIFANSDDILVGTSSLDTLMIGTNDEDTRGPDYYPIFALCHQATIAWLAVPVDLKLLATASGVVTTGPGTLETVNNWNAWDTSAQNSSIAFPISLPKGGPIYVWPRILDNDPGAFTYAIDGVVLGTFYTSPGAVIRTSNGIDNSLALIRLPAIEAGRHTVTLTQISASGTMRIVAVGSAPGPGRLLTRVLVGDPPLQETGPGATCNINPTQCGAYLAEIQADVALFVSDGLNVVFVDNHPYMLATPLEMNDELHPNSLGQSELRAAFETAIP